MFWCSHPQLCLPTLICSLLKYYWWYASSFWAMCWTILHRLRDGYGHHWHLTIPSWLNFPHASWHSLSDIPRRPESTQSAVYKQSSVVCAWDLSIVNVLFLALRRSIRASWWLENRSMSVSISLVPTPWYKLLEYDRVCVRIVNGYRYRCLSVCAQHLCGMAVSMDVDGRW